MGTRRHCLFGQCRNSAAEFFASFFSDKSENVFLTARDLLFQRRNVTLISLGAYLGSCVALKGEVGQASVYSPNSPRQENCFSHTEVDAHFLEQKALGGRDSYTSNLN